MPREAHTETDAVQAPRVETEIATLRSDIADLVKTIVRLEAQVTETRAQLITAAKGKAPTGAKNSANGHPHGHAAEDFATDAMKLGSDAVGTVEDVAKVGLHWVDDMLRKNPTPTLLTVLGVGFVLGIMGRR